MRAWVKLKNLTGTEFTGKIDDAIKLIDEIVASENDGSYDTNKMKWAVEVTKLEGILRDFLDKIRYIRDSIRCQDLSGNHLDAFTSLNKLVESYCFSPNDLKNSLHNVGIRLKINDRTGIIGEAKNLKTKLA